MTKVKITETPSPRKVDSHVGNKVIVRVGVDQVGKRLH